jgi:subfamily B ATP-binding cassette protein HlyB/CyaB
MENVASVSMFASRFSGSSPEIESCWQEFQQANLAVKSVGDIMNAPAEPYSMTPSREGGGRGIIDIRSLSFRYGENLPYLCRDLNPTIHPGQCVALMGRQAGKSTLAKLLQGFYPAERWCDLDRRSRYSTHVGERASASYGVVHQETRLAVRSFHHGLWLVEERRALWN